LRRADPLSEEYDIYNNFFENPFTFRLTLRYKSLVYLFIILDMSFRSYVCLQELTATPLLKVLQSIS